jgi:hypothetical protein
MAPTLVPMGIPTAVISSAAITVAIINPKRTMSEGYQMDAHVRSMGGALPHGLSQDIKYFHIDSRQRDPALKRTALGTGNPKQG